MPSTAARRFDALAIKRMSDRPQRGCPSDPNGTQDRRDLLSKGRCPFDQNGPPQQARFSQNVRIAQGYPRGLLGRKRSFGSLRNETAFLLGQGRIQVQHKRIGVSAEFCHDEGHTLRHQAGHKSHVTRKPVKLGNNYAAFRSLCGGQGCGLIESAGPGRRTPSRFRLQHTRPLS